jgi:hypothetical protein
MDTKEGLNKLLHLDNLLSKHDLTYEYSDDHSVYLRGDREYKVIQTLAEELKLTGYTYEVKTLFDKHYGRVF